MLSSGNSSPEICLRNLILLHEGDVIIDQCRGLRADLQDMPATTAYPFLQGSAFWVARHYEPRVNFSGLSITFTDSQESSFTLTPKISS